LIGCYENFPENVHGIASFNFEGSAKNIQEAIFCVFHQLTYEVHDSGSVTSYLTQKCDVSFELGVAEGDAFNFLDEKELDRCLRCITEKEFKTLDFFFVVRYHITRGSSERVPLRFDYHVLRLIFQQGCFEMRIRHEKGIQRIQLDDLVDFIAKRINAEIYRKTSNSLILERFEKVRLQ
jgi:hypothetical protein